MTTPRSSFGCACLFFVGMLLLLAGCPKQPIVSPSRTYSITLKDHPQASSQGFSPSTQTPKPSSAPTATEESAQSPLPLSSLAPEILPDLSKLPSPEQIAPISRQLPPIVHSMMPLQRWLSHLPIMESPPMSTCRHTLMQYARASLGRQVTHCTKAAQSARYRNNCSGWVRCVYSQLGIDIFQPPDDTGHSGTMAMFAYFRAVGIIHRGVPQAGDVVFWHATIDRNRNGRLDDDPLTHVGLVEGIDRDGRIRVLHTGYTPRPGVHRIYMYFPEPSLYTKRLANETAEHHKYAKRAKSARSQCHQLRKQFATCSKQARQIRKRYGRRHRKMRQQDRRCTALLRQTRTLCRTAKRYARAAKHGLFRTYNSSLVSPRSRKWPRWGHSTAELFAGYGTLRICPNERISHPSTRSLRRYARATTH